MALIIVSLLVLANGCGKRRPPLPPVERIPQRTEALSASQSGNRVVLSWPAPKRNASDQSVQSIRRVDVYRLAESSSAPLALTEDEFAARSTLIGSVSEDEIKREIEFITYSDTLELGGAPARLRYAIRYVNAAGVRAAFSNFVIIEPSARIGRPPALQTPTAAQDALNLEWAAPTANIDDSTPPNILGYNVYRAEADGAFVQLNKAPVAATAYADRDFVFGRSYRYTVRTISLGTGATPVESLDSNTVALTPRDTFAPGAPQRLSSAPATGRISLFYPASTATDVAGYNVFRSEDPSVPLERWTKLTPNLTQRNTFVDDSVVAGRKYYYYVTAIDTAGNRSAPSNIVSETAP